MDTSGSPNDGTTISGVPLSDRPSESATSTLPKRADLFARRRSAVQQVVREVDRIKAEIKKLRPLDSDVEARIMETFMLSWNYHSNAIEGNTLSLGETKTFLKHGLTAKGKPFKDYLDIEGHDEALDYLTQFVNSERPLTEAVIRELHSILLVEPYEVEALTPDGQKTTKRVALGAYKTTPNHVRTVTGKVHRYASPEETPSRMSDLMDWYRKAENDDILHPLAIATLYHHEFTAIHPFDDGNGRMARILTNLMLMRHGCPPLIVKQEHKEDYFYALATADEGDVTELLTFFGDALIDAMQLYLRGTRGESIDELSDFDKRLALLERSLTTKENEAEQTKTRDAQMKVFAEFIEPLFAKLNPRYEKIDQLFGKSGQELKYGASEDGEFCDADHSDLISAMRSLFQGIDVFEIIAEKYWTYFNNDPSKNLPVKHNIYLGRTEFTVEVYVDMSFVERFTGTYGEPIFEEQVTEFASTVLNRVFERLEALRSG